MKTLRPQKNLDPQHYSDDLLDALERLNHLWADLQKSWRKASLQAINNIIKPLTCLPEALTWVKKADDLETYAQILSLNLVQIQQQDRIPNYTERGNIQEQIDDLNIMVKQFLIYLKNPFHDISGHAHKTICIVSADENLQQSLSQTLKKAGYYVQILANIKALLQAIHLFTPQALLVDMRLKQNSVNVMRVIYTIQKSRRQPLSILCLSHKNTLKARLAAVRIGCQSFFIQPVPHRSILMSLEKLQTDLPEKKYTVLLLDDQGDYYQKYHDILNTGKLQLHYTDQAMATPNLEQVDLLLIRMELENITGLELSKIIRQQAHYLHLPIIILTRELEQYLSQSAHQGIADDVIQDKVSPERLACLIQNRIEHSQYRQQVFSEYTQKDQFTGVYNKDYLLNYLQSYQAPKQAIHPLSIWVIDLSQTYHDDNIDPLQIENKICLDASVVIQQYHHQQDKLAVWDSQRLILLSEQYASLDVSMAAQHLVKRLQSQIQHKGYGLKNCIIGIAIYQKHHNLAHKTLWCAKQACDELLKNPKTDYQVLLDDSHISAQYQEIVSPKRQDFIAKQLQQALSHHNQQTPNLQLCYQPITHIHGKQIPYYDSLLRLYHQDSDSIAPSEFLQVASKYKQSGEVDRWVIKQALNDLAAKYQQQQAVRFFVKLDDCSLEDPSFIDCLQDCLKDLDIPHDALIFDINSYHAVANPYLRSFVVGIKSLGCGLSLRNFLYEPNHLDLLEQLSLDFIKLHPSLTENLEANSDIFAQIKTIVAMARQRGCETVAIRLEHADKLSLLWQAQIDYVAGNFVQAPDKHLDFNFAA